MTPHQIVLLALIKALTQEVTLLENELAQQTMVVATTTPIVFAPPIQSEVITTTIPPVIIQQPTLQSAPINIAPQPVITPSCDLVITPDTGNGLGLSWSSQNESGSGTLFDNYKGIYDGGVPQFQVIEQYVAPSGTQIDLQNFTQAKLQFSDGTTCSAQF
jgi:hypothetical protein